MATIEDRPFSKNYSGLVNQSVVAAVIFTICVTSHEYMKRKRRGRRISAEGLGSVESWQFGYLFQGRSWALNPSPPIPQGWPLAWVPQAISFPLDRLNELRGVDATLYVRFLVGCVGFTLLHSLTTLPILLPIHVTFSDASIPPKSMVRASISSLVSQPKGQSLLWVHLLLLIWVTVTWMITLLWICRGAFRYREQNIRRTMDVIRHSQTKNAPPGYHPHPHPQFPFHELPPLESEYDRTNKGLRTRTVMVTNIPHSLRSEKELKEYFEYYLSKPLAKPSMGVTSAAQPGVLDRSLAFAYNKTANLVTQKMRQSTSDTERNLEPSGKRVSRLVLEKPLIDRVVFVRKMSDLASLLERREEALRNLETAHIKLARNALEAVREAKATEANPKVSTSVRISTGIAKLTGRRSRESQKSESDLEEGTDEGEDRMHLLIRTLSPYLESSPNPLVHSSPTRRPSMWKLLSRRDSDVELQTPIIAPEKSIWEALLSLPRSTLDAYQPLIHLSALFRGKTVPSIDYHTAKLNLVTSLITEKRTIPPQEYPAMGTAFVTFQTPEDARRACKYLAVHPNNPVNACLVSMAPQYEDLDWTRLMKSTFRVEFVKDWVVNIGVWGFTIFWVFPVTSIVGLVSIQTISKFWPGLQHWLDRHQWESEVLASFLPTVLVALLALLIPLILLLIAKKAHTISTLSALHDRIMTRYYKFLIVNVLVFFCVGTVALQSFLVSFKAPSGDDILQVVSSSFPTAGPFYVGWMIFTMAMHGGIELALFGLPLLVYPATKRQVTPRKRAVGIRPRTFNYYYWIPNHLLVVHILLLFAVLNPLVIPFGFLYFCVEAVVVKNQLLHVYAKNYEGNGQTILIRLLRYSMDGLILCQAVFLAYMVVLKKKANVGVSAVLIILTVISKVLFTRYCRARFEHDDLLEAKILCGSPISPDPSKDEPAELIEDSQINSPIEGPHVKSPKKGLEFLTLKLASKFTFTYGSIHRQHNSRHPPIPFRTRASIDSSAPLRESSSRAELLKKNSLRRVSSLPNLTDSPIMESPPQIPSPHEDHSSTLVTPHHPHPVWNDESNPDTPYENPYYTRPISDTLWLPRDPLGILDLDDTVDMKVSLTSEPGAGKLGAWQEEEFITSSISSAFIASFGSVEEEDDDEILSNQHTPPIRVDGTEAIDLPVGIASRVELIDHERGVETTSPRRPSMLSSRRPSVASGTRPSIMRIPSTFNGIHPSGYRSFSGGSASSSHQTSPSRLNLPDAHHRHRTVSVDAFGVRLVGHHPFRPTTATSHHSGFSHPSLISPSRPHASAASRSVISTREAVVNEAMVEEHEAALERQRQEQVEEERAKEPRSWLTAWMFSKG